MELGVGVDGGGPGVVGAAAGVDGGDLVELGVGVDGGGPGVAGADADVAADLGGVDCVAGRL